MNKKSLFFSIILNMILHSLLMVIYFPSANPERVALSIEKITVSLRSAKLISSEQVQKAISPQKNIKSTSKNSGSEKKFETKSDLVISPTIGKIQNRYLNNLRELIENHKFYPPASIKLKEQGDVEVKFNILQDGEINDVLVTKSSGFKRLDQAAIETILNLKKYVPIPKELQAAKLTITQNIKYELNSI